MPRFQVIPSAAPAKIIPLPAAPRPEPNAESLKPLLVIGSRVHCTLHGGADGIVFRIHGEQRPETVSTLGRGVVVTGGNASFDIVFTGHNPHVSNRLPEALVRSSSQWRILSSVADAAEIRTALAAAEAQRLENEREAARQAEARKERRESLAKEYAWLKRHDQTKGKRISSHALGSQNLKAELTRAFPGVKFSVKSDSFSGGDSIDVSWEFGPTLKDVCRISDKYQEGHFDGMQDIYESNDDNVWPGLFGGAKYVHEHRSFGDTFYETLGRALCELQGVVYNGHYTANLLGENDPHHLDHYVGQLLALTTFPPGFKFKGVEHTGREWTAFAHAMHTKHGDGWAGPNRTKLDPAEQAMLAAFEAQPSEHWVRIVFEQPAATTLDIRPGTLDSVATITPSKHTKLGHAIWVVQLVQRVDRPDYLRARELAHQHNGYYSNYKGNGAIPGFIFKVEAQAIAFLNEVTTLLGGTTPAARPETPDPNSKAAQWQRLEDPCNGFNPPPPVIINRLTEKFAQTHRNFQAALHRIAAVAGMEVLAVYALWREYELASRSSDQSAILSEFADWYAPKLGGDRAALRDAACPPVANLDTEISHGVQFDSHSPMRVAPENDHPQALEGIPPEPGAPSVPIITPAAHAQVPSWRRRTLAKS